MTLQTRDEEAVNRITLNSNSIFDTKVLPKENLLKYIKYYYASSNYEQNILPLFWIFRYLLGGVIRRDVAPTPYYAYYIDGQ